jgi:SAM-dependent methyltransferase
MQCNVCNSPLGDPIFEAASGQALTSLCEVRPGTTRVWACHACGHLRGDALEDTEAYYESEYRILLDQEDEDQIYEVHGDRVIYRTEHQVSTLLGKLKLPSNALLLDYGCAKASTPQRLLKSREDLQVHLFDVSKMYKAYWDRFLTPDRYAVHQTPDTWQRRFDVVTSFFALEHIPSPQETIHRIAALLKEDGIFYGIVPDTFGNVADFVVIDHVNHFTASSLHALLRQGGFSEINIDADAHRGALVFTACKAGTPTQQPSINEARLRSSELARYWNALGTRVRAAELASDKAPAAIYGSGFYGAYILSLLQHPEHIQCFLDRSPYQQGKQLFDKPILPPDQTPDSIQTMYIGLNPTIARETVAQMNWLHGRDLELVFLDEGPQ